MTLLKEREEISVALINRGEIMEIWLDTVSPSTILAAGDYNFFWGVTTNPTLVANAGEDIEELLTKILELQEGPVAVQLKGSSEQTMMQEAKKLYSFSDRFIIKVPVSQEGLIALNYLSSKRIPTMATAVFHSNQYLQAALAGADYVAPYLGRMFDAGLQGFSILSSMIKIKSVNGFKTKILAAGVTEVEHISQCAELGIDAITLKDEILREFMSNHPLTTQAVEIFNHDWDRIEESRIFMS